MQVIGCSVEHIWAARRSHTMKSVSLFWWSDREGALEIDTFIIKGPGMSFFLQALVYQVCCLLHVTERHYFALIGFLYHWFWRRSFMWLRLNFIWKFFLTLNLEHTNFHVKSLTSCWVASILPLLDISTIGLTCNTGQHHLYYVPWNYWTFEEKWIQYRGSIFSSYLLVLCPQCGHGVYSWELTICAPESHQTRMKFCCMDIKRHGITEKLLETSSLLC
jgi:hypothetical protein